MGRKPGFKHSEEAKEKIRKSNIGRIAWNKGKKYKCSHSYNQGKNHPNYKGTIHKKCLQCENIFDGMPCHVKKQKFCSKSCGLKYTHKNFPELFINQREAIRQIGLKNKGRKHSVESRRLRSMPMEKNPNWKGGISFEEYPPEFNKELKEKIRHKFERICGECGYSEDELGYRLSVHHIDYNKKNCKINNLIPLCNNCHQQTNFKRIDWTNYFQNKIGDLNGNNFS